MNQQISDTDRDHLSLAQRILKANPEDALARQVVEQFIAASRNGKRIEGFSGFMLREPDAQQTSNEVVVRDVDD